MTTPRPENFSPELLAAYADGELSAEECLRVERWLAENPEARESLEVQEAMAPGNVELWGLVSPPAPSAAEWISTRDGIGSQLRLAQRVRLAGWAGTLGLLTTAAILILVLPGPQHNGTDPELRHEFPGPPPSGSSDDEPYPMASASDVLIISLPESAAGLLVVGEHPLTDSFLSFAKLSDVQFHGIGSDLAGRFPEVMSKATEDVLPMLWAPREP
ncbi:MAG: hypothetical protein EXS09_03100 [Gemmataceae bacterium]|nr:hypothetical protein [Gemmataceae bacterium]